MALGLELFVLGVAAQDHDVTPGGLVGRGAVDGQLPTTRFPLDVIGGQPLPVCDVVDFDTFEWHDVGRVREDRVDTDRSFVLEIGIGDRRSVDLGFQKCAFHKFISCVLFWSSWRLSISLVLPSLTAIGSTARPLISSSG